MTQPYAEQSKEVEGKYYRLKLSEFCEVGGVLHYSARRELSDFKDQWI
jgi:hypothetical protein